MGVSGSRNPPRRWQFDLSFSLCPNEGPLSPDISQRRGGLSSTHIPAVATDWGVSAGGGLSAETGSTFSTVILALSENIVLMSSGTQLHSGLYNTLKF
jgi:hypothetical protein